MTLHPAQKKLLDILRDNAEEPLSIRDLQELINSKSPSVVQHHLTQLEKKGFLRRNPNNPRDYQILAEAPDKYITYLNIYGMAQCGPNGSVFDGNPIDRIPVYSRILGFPSEEAFIVKARGDSMIPKVNPGDYVIARKSNLAENGQIVVCTNDGKVLIKKVQIFKDDQGNIKYNLISINHSKFQPFIASNDFRIEGIVKGILTYSV